MAHKWALQLQTLDLNMPSLDLMWNMKDLKLGHVLHPCKWGSGDVVAKEDNMVRNSHK